MCRLTYACVGVCLPFQLLMPTVYSYTFENVSNSTMRFENFLKCMYVLYEIKYFTWFLSINSYPMHDNNDNSNQSEGKTFLAITIWCAFLLSSPVCRCLLQYWFWMRVNTTSICVYKFIQNVVNICNIAHRCLIIVGFWFDFGFAMSWSDA